MTGSLLGEAAISLYGLAGSSAMPLAGALLNWRGRHGKEDAARRGERFGIAPRPRPDGPLVWVHAASVGETLTALPLIGRLALRGPAVLLTTGTVTGAQIVRNRLPLRAIHQYAPIDTPVAICRFLDHWRPDLVLFTESEFWPTILKELNARGVPLAVINGRVSDRSFRAWRIFRPVARAMLRRIDLCLAQTPLDAERLRLLGARRVLVSGNLKFDVPPPHAEAATLAAMRNAIGDRLVLVAASTHPGEEQPVIRAHAALARRGSKLLTIIAPRHPERGAALAEEVAAAGLAVRRRSTGETPEAATDIFIADTIGEMGVWYGLAGLAFLGGSLVPRGGQNPIEPAKLHVPVLHGPHVGNFREAYVALAAADAAVGVEGEASLLEAIEALVENPGMRTQIADKAQACVAGFAGALDRTLEALQPLLLPLVADAEAAART